MKIVKQPKIILMACVIGSLVFAIASPAEAQQKYGPLFDKFSLSIGGSWIGLSTEIRLDSEVFGEGTKLNFEDDLNLDSGKTIPTASFDWQIGRKHKLGFRWQDISRDSSAQALTDIEWGDDIIPIDAQIGLGFDITQSFLDYTYYPWVNEKWAAGFGIGLRVMDIQATLAWNEGEIIDEGSSEIKGTGPLPYLYFEYRRMFSDNWRFITGLGWLYLEIDDIKGGQWIGRAGIEYLLGDHWAFGGALNLAQIDVDWKAVQTEEGENLLTLALDMNVSDLTVFARFRF